MSPRRVKILGVEVDAQTLDDAVDRIGGWVARGVPTYVCVTGVHGVMASQDDPELRRIHNEAGMVTTDGMPLVWLCRSSLRDGGGAQRVERVYGPDLMRRAFERSEAAGWRHFLFGSTPATLDRLRMRLRDQFPRARVVGAHSPPHRPIEPGGGRDRVAGDAIARANPDIVWVGLGTPKQERWMAAHVGRVGAPVLVGVGAAFDFLAGTKPQASPWIRRAGLEWAFRLAHEPRRLAGRYLRNNPRFAVLLARQALGKHGKTWNYVR
jgi:N-acetylglucosaminyldiphosphoundecaprenol N-acetyl-beta-D-mannosaminyltransferase